MTNRRWKVSALESTIIKHISMYIHSVIQISLSCQANMQYIKSRKKQVYNLKGKTIHLYDLVYFIEGK